MIEEAHAEEELPFGAFGSRLTPEEVRDAFLASTRGVTALNRELEKLGVEIERRVKDLPDLGETLSADVKRIPGRCTVQLGPVALSLSWVRAQAAPASAGRLLVIEWEGTLGKQGGRGSDETTSRFGVAARAASAKVARETVLRVQATKADDWRWHHDDARDATYDSVELAQLCVDSLARSLRKAQKAALSAPPAPVKVAAVAVAVEPKPVLKKAKR